MENNLLKLKDNIRELGDDLPDVLADIIRNNEHVILDMNTQDQLYERGINRLGVSLADFEPYAPFTLRMKQMTGQPTDRVTLRDTGDFTRSFYLDVSKEGFEIKAADTKTNELVAKYGKQIFGLTKENSEELVKEYIIPDLMKHLKKAIDGADK